ncbi:MAG: radical SAM protein [Candidatus Thorarchaeota archaeon]
MSECAMDIAYPSELHPCWSHSRKHIWERIHLPVARSCNVKCSFCDRKHASRCHTPSPGSSRILMTPNEAVKRTLEEIKRRPNLRIAAVSGPGEPLANDPTFDTLQGIKTAIPDIHFCISTNGILLANKITRILKFDVETVSVSISTVNPSSAARIYEWAVIDGKLLRGEEMGKLVIEKQLEGICKASRAGIRVKVNTILIPTINGQDIGDLASEVSRAGATLQNIVPLVPTANMMEFSAPSQVELETARQAASLYIDQFHHCHQCRSDVVGIPGDDTPL